jgi:hypothetical protein
MMRYGALLKLIQDVAGVGQRPGEPVQLRHDEGVARSTGGQGESETWTVAASACEAAVEIDAVGADAECIQTITLSGEVLLLCRPPARIPPLVRSPLREDAVSPRRQDRDWPPGKGPLAGRPDRSRAAHCCRVSQLSR